MDNQNLLAAIEELLDKKLEPINNKLIKIEGKLDSVFNQVADLTEFKTDVNTKLDNISSEVSEIKEDLSAVELVTSKNWNEIARLKIAK
ncbi:hypothetical protein ABG79_01644 [Caloramator mitchellensis]|uniref:Uncharacterized protein n=1 Tax=Caloramator mitchellensis TaxID=908809 RepID=A0A0R3JTU9_CALMK|nr:hypothetical protein [Caloramator mitchellensis]KRQ86442.1 hypothetical protein ABG79_01644 [Caloramator mitchellensis]